MRKGKKNQNTERDFSRKENFFIFLKATPHKMRWRGLRWQKSPPDSPAPHLKFFLLYKDHKENRMKRKFWESKHLSKHQGWSSLGAYLGLHSTYATWLLTSAPKHTGTGASSGYLLAENQLQNWDPRLSPCHPPWLVGGLWASIWYHWAPLVPHDAPSVVFVNSTSEQGAIPPSLALQTQWWAGLGLTTKWWLVTSHA